MITDERRRRVVHTLRQLDHIVDDEDCDRTIVHEASVLNMIRDATSGLDGSIFQRLADLIDPPDNPTCRNLSNDYRSFHCSRCGGIKHLHMAIQTATQKISHIARSAVQRWWTNDYR